MTASLNTQAKNTVLAGPASGANANPTFRALGTFDISPSWYGTDTTSTNTYVLNNVSPAVPALITGLEVNFTVANANTGAAKLQVNSLAQIAITKNGATALVAGDLAPGVVAKVVYDGTRWQLLNPQTEVDTGTVSSFSSGGLTPLFTTSVATATTTPALSFTLSNAGAHAFLGNNTGGSAAPAYVQPAFTDISGTVGNAQLSGTYSTNALTFSNAGNSFTGTHTGNGAGLTSLTAGNLTGQVAIANGGTGATTLAGATIPVFTGAITTGNCVKWNSATSITDAGGVCGTGTVTTSGTPTSGTPTEFAGASSIKNGVVADFITFGLAPTASPTFTGTPAAPTATGGTNTTQIATTAFVQSAVSSTSPSFANITSGTNATTLTMGTGGSLAFTGTSTLNMTANTSANALTVPSISGAAPTTNGAIAYNTATSELVAAIGGVTTNIGNNKRTICYIAGADNTNSPPLAAGTDPGATDSINGFFHNMIGALTVPATSGAVWCQTNIGSATFNLVDATGPVNFFASPAACSTAGTSLTPTATSIANGDSINFVLSTVTSSPTRITVCFLANVN